MKGNYARHRSISRWELVIGPTEYDKWPPRYAVDHPMSNQYLVSRLQVREAQDGLWTARGTADGCYYMLIWWYW